MNVHINVTVIINVYLKYKCLDEFSFECSKKCSYKYVYESFMNVNLNVYLILHLDNRNVHLNPFNIIYACPMKYSHQNNHTNACMK